MKTNALIALSLFLASSCASTSPRTESAAARTPVVASIPTLPGPRRTVAVAKFDSIDSFAAAHGGWDVGGGLAAMLADALAQTGSFHVLERADLGNVLSEQELVATGLVNAESGPRLGKLAGAQFLIFGSVTEFDQNERGGGFSLGVAGLKGFGGAIAPQTTQGHVAITIRVVDTTTGEVVKTFRVEEKTSSTAVSVNLNYKQVSFGSNAFERTPLGTAARGAVVQAVQRFATVAASRPWQGRIVRYDGKVAYLNAGSSMGLRVGDRFRVFRSLGQLIDPATGLSLGERKTEVGSIEVMEIQEKVALCISLGDAPLQRGDLVLPN